MLTARKIVFISSRTSPLLNTLSFNSSFITLSMNIVLSAVGFSSTLLLFDLLFLGGNSLYLSLFVWYSYNNLWINRENIFSIIKKISFWNDRNEGKNKLHFQWIYQSHLNICEICWSIWITKKEFVVEAMVEKYDDLLYHTYLEYDAKIQDSHMFAFSFLFQVQFLQKKINIYCFCILKNIFSQFYHKSYPLHMLLHHLEYWISQFQHVVLIFQWEFSVFCWTLDKMIEQHYNWMKGLEFCDGIAIHQLIK